MHRETLQTDAGLRTAWETFATSIEPLRPDLFRFCLKLTGNPFDAEDLVHDGMLKAFGSLALYRHQIYEPRGYMLRVLCNLWVDATRRRARVECRDLEDVAATSGTDSIELREAVSGLLEHLNPRERFVLVMKEVFEMSHREIADALSMSEGAVKVAMHRTRKRLPLPAAPAPTAPARCHRELVQRFIDVFQTHDMEAIKALLTEDFQAEVFPAGAARGRDYAAEKNGWLYGCFYHHIPEREAAQDPYPLHLVLQEVASEPVVLVFRDHGQGTVLEEIWRFESDDGALARVTDYGFCPDLVRHVAEDLDVPFGFVGYRFATASYRRQPSSPSAAPQTRTPPISGENF